ncbi:amino acid-binding protein [Thermoproteota archaeon]
MKIKQISVFIENNPGHLYNVVKTLANHNVNIRAISLAETADFGIIRMIVNNPDEAYNILKENKFSVSFTDVLAVAVSDDVGGIAKVLALTNPNNENINIEYLYAFAEKHGDHAIIIFRFDNPDKVIEIFKKHNIKVLSEEEVKKL